MRDDIFKSMKNQMMPSDDCVNDLLAKIAALDASPEMADTSNVLKFEPRYKEVKTPNRISRKVWGTATAAVAAAVCLVSVFGTIGDSPEDIQAQVGNIIDNPEVIINQEEGQTAETAPIIDENKQLSQQELDEILETKDVTKYEKKEEKTEEAASSQETAEEQGEQVEKTETVTVDETKLAPSKASENELTWTQEILADSAVKEITVEGSNYVVDSSVASIATGSAIETVSLSVPETATTQADTVSGSALKVANVSTDLAVAVDVTEFDGKLIYLNSDYDPETLGQFLNDAGIQNGTNFTSVVYTGDRVGYSSGKRIKGNIKNIAVEFLFVTNAERAAASHYNAGNEKIVFVSTSNPTGTKISFGVSNSGYLKVILANGNTYTFNIGQDNANAFIDKALES